MRICRITAKIAAVCMLLFLNFAFAQDYPNKPIRIVYGFAPGGGPDVLGRLLSKQLFAQMGQPVIFENRPGATSTIAAAAVAKAPPDGYTILMITPTHVIAPNFYRQLTFDPIVNFAPVTMVASQPLFLGVNADSPIKSVSDLISLAKSKPGVVNYATPGVGSPQHLATELFAANAGIRMVHVPYKSGSEMTVALLSGEVQMVLLGLAPMLSHVKSGRLRLLAVAADKRYPAVPEVPTFSEVGLPGTDVDNWIGIVAPAGTPKNVIEKLNAQIAKAMEEPEMGLRLAQQGAVVNLGSSADFGVFMKEEAAKWAKAARASGAKAE